jgi:Fur family ferric uptake transcriptional regulator
VATQSSGLDPGVTERIGELRRERGLRRMSSRITVMGVLEIPQRLPECLPAGVQPLDRSTRTVTTVVDQGVLHALTLDGG